MSSGDVVTSVGLEILRGDLTQRMDPLKKQQPEEPKQLDRLAQLEVKLEEQLEEQEKWEDLTRKLEQKAQEMSNTVVRLDTSVKVFRGELANRGQNVAYAQEKLDDKREEQRRAIEKLEKDKAKQLEFAENAKETVEKTAEELEEAEDRQEELTKKLRAARSSLLPLEERVQNLESNLNGNRGMSDSQRFYYSAECQAEREQRDRILLELHAIYKDLEKVNKTVDILQGKMGLFQDEEQRRIMKAKALDKEIEETKEFYWNQLTKLEAQMDAIRRDRDEWEAKTNKLADDLEHTKMETSKLTVKARLFNEQLKGIKANVDRLKAIIEDTRETRSDTSASSDEEEDDEEDLPEPSKEEPYVWKPIQKSEVGLGVVQPKAPAPVQTVFSYYQPSAPTQSHSPPPAAAKVEHTKAQPNSVGICHEPAETKKISSDMHSNSANDSGLAVQLRSVQMDLERQKRFQQEQSLKVEQQISRLVAKMDVLVNTASPETRVSNASAESQLSALKHQMQADARKDSYDIRQLLEQVSKQCDQLTKKVEDLTRDGEKREQDQVRVERMLRERESQYTEQLNDLRSDMQRQMQRQQQIFAERMSQAMMQMEKFVEGGDREAAMRDDSMASLESLAPLDSSSRRSSRNTLDEENDDARVPGGFSMVQTGISVGNSPLMFGKK